MMRFKTVALATLATVVAAGGPRSAMADVDLTSTPMVSNLTKVVAPNVHFILDDSGSMNDDFMPDSVDGNQSRMCFRNFGYNKIYYNPATTYAPPLNSDGTSFAAATYTAAKVNGFQVASPTTDLSAPQSVAVRLGNNPFTTTNNSFTVKVAHPNHGLSTGASVRFTNTSGTLNNVALNNQTVTITKVDDNSYTFTSPTKANKTGTGGGNSPTRANFSLPTGTYWEYVANPGSPPSTCQADTAYRFRTPSTAAELTNYANWYAYYRTRLSMMKSASGRAFASIDDRYRIGLDRINNRNNSNVMVNIAKFDAAQKATWYTQLYGVTGNSFTPLRGALSKAGRLFAGKVVTGDDDPVQYSCQQNFAILTTDGYWNPQNEVTGTAATNYGPRRIDNVAMVGDQDGSESVPYKDAGLYQDTLADVAMYFYKTDLRPTDADPAKNLGGKLADGTRIDVTPDDVQPVGDDKAEWQHMTTFGLGLGVAGTLGFAPKYEIASADYIAIAQGTKNWPNPESGPVPVVNPATELATRIDDLWHAAVNGRGRYLSASNPDSVIEELTKALAAIAIKTGSAAAAATSTLEPVAGDQYAYLAQFTTEKWYGDLQARDIQLDTGQLDTVTKWSARDLLTSKVTTNSDSRTIKTFDAAASNKLKEFTAANLATEIAANYFEPSALTQWGIWDATQKSTATDAALINFIRGQTGFEDEDANDVVVAPGPPPVVSDENRLFRDREYVLGDIVNTSPVYVQSPPFSYGDAGYAAFKDLHRKKFNPDGSVSDPGRQGAVYVGANDGMLHAFRADTGEELWAYIPSAVVPNLHKLADAAYANNHQFYVDGPITVGDAYNGSEWKTVLVGGLGRGGKAYYALDVTDPANPKALWEFGTAQDDDLGYSYGNAILTKRSSDGKWVVIFASGYNNNTSGGDSKGRIYVVDAFTGAKLNEFITSSAADENQSGIAKINNWVLDTLIDNVTRYVYGGDLGGSLWRFDLEETVEDDAAVLLGKTSATAGNQPITVKPELARIKDGSGNYQRTIYFGTGRYLGFDDLKPAAPSSAIAQAIYAVKDTGADLGVFSDPSEGNLVEQTLVYDTSTTPRKIDSPQPVDWATRNGWYMELPVGERVNVDPRLQLGTLAVVANAPKDDYCTFGGKSWLYKLDFATGTAVNTATDEVVGSYISGSIATGLTLIRLPNKKLVALVTLADTTVQAMDLPIAPGAGTALRRVGWREIF